MTITIDPAVAAAMRAHAVEGWPEEVCGVVLEGPGGPVVRRMTNVQNQIHAADLPETVGQLPRPGMIVGQAHGHFLEGDDAGRRKDAHLPHPTSEHLANMTRPGNELL